jgi:ABC-2 type transport system ATP-binding protein
MASILSLKKISKTFGRIKALKEVSFDVPTGSVFGILGPNGSGKTTLLGIVMDVLSPNGGSYEWFGNSPSGKQRERSAPCWKHPISIITCPRSIT